MSDLHIIMSSGKTVHFNILDDGWLGADVGLPLLYEVERFVTQVL